MSAIYNASCTLASTYQQISLEGGGLVTALPSKIKIVINNTNILTAFGMYDLEEEAFWSTNGSLTGTLLDQFGNVITTVNMFLASGSSGNFVGTFGGSGYSPAVGRGYTLLFQGTSDWGNAFSLPVLAEVVQTPLISNQTGDS
jgi:hypothetical protein